MTNELRVDVIYGTVQLVQTQRREGTRIIMGGYAIRRDLDGNEISRTENVDNIRLECFDDQAARHWEAYGKSLAKQVT